MVTYTREMDHSNVLNHLHITNLENRKIYVDLGNRKAVMHPRTSSEIGWHVVPNNQNHAYILTDCRVGYDKEHNPTRFLYRAKQGPILQERAPARHTYARPQPRNPEWNAAMREPEKEGRLVRARRVTETRKRLLPAAACLETLACLREARQWLAAIADKAVQAQNAAAQPLQQLADRIHVLIDGLPD